MHVIGIIASPIYRTVSIGNHSGGHMYTRSAIFEGRIHPGREEEFFRIVEEIVADRLAQQAGEARIALHQPAARRNAIGLVVDTVRVKAVQIGKDRFLHQIGMKGGNAVDGM